MSRGPPETLTGGRPKSAWVKRIQTPGHRGLSLVEAVCTITGRRRVVTGLPDRLSYLQAWLLEHLPGKLMTRDN